MNLDQRIAVKGVLSQHGISNLVNMSIKDLVRFYYICRGTPVATLFAPRNTVMPRRMIPDEFRQKVA